MISSKCSRSSEPSGRARYWKYPTRNTSTAWRSRRLPDRFGADRLRDALEAFGRWFDTMLEPLTDALPNPVRWKALQERSLEVAERLKAELRGVGLWLF